MIKLVKLSGKLFLYNSFLFGSFIVLFVTINAYLIRELVLYNITKDLLNFLANSQILSMIVFIYFAFISFDYFGKIRNTNLAEVLSALSNGKSKAYLSKVIIICILALCVFITILTYNAAVYFVAQVELPLYFNHILKNNLLNILFIAILAILFGFNVALAMNKFTAYTVITAVIFLVSPIKEFIFFPLRFFGINTYVVSDLFLLLPPDLNWVPDKLYGIPIEPCRWQIVLFWVLILLIIALNQVYSSRKKSMLYPFLLGPGIAAAVCFILYLNPGSIVLKDHRPDGYVEYDVRYYWDNEQKVQPANYKITAYSLELEIDKILEAAVYVQIESQTVLDTYNFTLYRNYRVDQVIDEYGQELNFNQTGDYLEVFNPQGADISALSIKYRGFSPVFYSNRQGIWLPGYFPYYPLAGFREIYDIEQQAFITGNQNPNAFFSVTLKSKLPVYTNLHQESENIFEGEAESLTIIGGFVQEYHIADNIVYCFVLDNPALKAQLINNIVINTEDSLAKTLAQYKSRLGETRDYSFNNKKIIQAPHAYTGQAEALVVFSDHIITRDLNADYMVTALIASFLPDCSAKEALKRVIFFYLQDDESFIIRYSDYESNLIDTIAVPDDVPYDEWLKFAEMANRPEIVGGLLVELIDAHGEELVLKEVYSYLLDIENTENEIDYLLNLLEEGVNNNAEYN